MKKYYLLLSSAFLLLFINSYIVGQEQISWLNDFTSDINTGSYTYKYIYSAVDNNACKIKVEEQKTDKKANTLSKSYIFYLSDLDPSSFSFKPSGSTIIVNLGTKLAQKFISVYTNNNIDEYASSITIYLDAVDKARSFIDAVKSHCNECKMSDLSWTTRDEAFAWLNKNIGESSNSGSLIKQTFTKGAKSYLAQLAVEKTDSKGTTQTIYTFDLSDIDPKGIILKVTGKTLKIDLPVKGSEYYIQTKINNQSVSYVKAIELYADDIEVARNLVNALNYVGTTAQPGRKEWKQYTLALDYVKDNLKEVAVGTNKINQAMSYVESPSGIVSFKAIETDAKGVQTEEINSIYLNDLSPVIKLEVTAKNASLVLEIKDKNKFIKQTRENKTLGYSGSLKLYVDDIDQARDLIGALEFAIKNSTTGVQDFASIQKAIEWLTKNQGDVTIDTKSYHQTMQINSGAEDLIDLNVITSDAAGASINERYEIYPEDLSLDEMKVKVSGKKLYVPLSNGKLKYIKVFKGDVQQNYTANAEILFEDIQQAKNFIAALSYIHEKSKIADRSMKDNMTAYAYLEEHIAAIEVAGIKREQKIEQLEQDVCKLKYTHAQTDSKGVSTENSYEFMLTDIDPLKSLITVSGKNLQISLVTKEKQKLIKPYKNGEVEPFIYNVDIVSDDVLIAKKILAAFMTLTKGCK
jgi:hypothetical protein